MPFHGHHVGEQTQTSLLHAVLHGWSYADSYPSLAAALTTWTRGSLHWPYPCVKVGWTRSHATVQMSIPGLPTCQDQVPFGNGMAWNQIIKIPGLSPVQPSW